MLYREAMEEQCYVAQSGIWCVHLIQRPASIIDHGEACQNAECCTEQLGCSNMFLRDNKMKAYSPLHFHLKPIGHTHGRVPCKHMLRPQSPLAAVESKLVVPSDTDKLENHWSNNSPLGVSPHCMCVALTFQNQHGILFLNILNVFDCFLCNKIDHHLT